MMTLPHAKLEAFKVAAELGCGNPVTVVAEQSEHGEGWEFGWAPNAQVKTLWGPLLDAGAAHVVGWAAYKATGTHAAPIWQDSWTRCPRCKGEPDGCFLCANLGELPVSDLLLAGEVP